MADYDISEAFQKIEEIMIASMSRNMSRHLKKEHSEGINYSMWQAEQLAALNVFRKNNEKAFSGYFSTINKRIETILKMAYQSGLMDQETRILEAIKRGWKVSKLPTTDSMQGAFFRINERKLNALIEAVTNDMKKAEVAMLRKANDEYRKAIYNAEVYYNTGVGTLSQCVDMATKDFLSRGISCIEFANGAMVGIDSYARMALRTAQTRAYLHGEAAKRDEWGVSTVIVNKRGVACPRCLQWVGRVFYDDVWGNAPIPTPEKYPRLSEAIKGGLYHPNCKDVHTTFFEGISTPPEPMTAEEKKEAARVYNLEQQQRYNERQIRKYKRLSEGSVDPDNKEAYQKKLKAWQAKQRDFVKANGDVLKRRYDNESTYGIGPIDNKDTRKTIARTRREVALEKLKVSKENHLTNTGKRDKIPSERYGFRTNRKAHTIEDDIGTPNNPTCNPNYSKRGDYALNCGYCSATYEMRRRGCDVVANPKHTMFVSDWLKLFDKATPINLTSTRTDALVEELKQKCSAMGNGARGSLYVSWKGRTVGHFFSWEVKDGNVLFVDGQTGKTDVTSYFEQVRPTKTICVRWDNLEPTDMIKDACKNRGGD